MSMSNNLTRTLFASVSPLALAAGVAMMSTPAEAVNTLTVTTTTFAAENFSSANAVTTTASPVVIASTTTATDMPNGSNFILTLSNSSAFVAIPATTTTANVTLGTGSLATGSTAIQYNVTAVTANSTASVTIGSFSITNVGSRLATPANNITVTLGTASGSFNVPSVSTGVLALSAAQYTFTGAAGSGISVDLANNGQGVQFRGTSANQLFGSAGTLAVNASAAAAIRDISGTSTFAAAVGDSVRAVITGNFSAFTGTGSVYLVTPTSTSCAATAPSGAISASVSTDQRSATATGLAIGSTYNVCVVANGTTVIPASPNNISGSVSISYSQRTVGTTSYTPTQPTQATTVLSTVTYNGGVTTAFYVVGAGSYTSAVRVSNTGTSSGPVFVAVNNDTDSTTYRALLDSTLAAGQSKFYFGSDIRTAAVAAGAPSTTLVDSNTRARVTFLTGFSSANLQNFIVNPGGVLSGGAAVTSGTTGTLGN